MSAFTMPDTPHPLRLLEVSPATYNDALLKTALLTADYPVEKRQLSSMAALRLALQEKSWDAALYLTGAPITPQAVLKAIEDAELDIPVIIIAAPENRKLGLRAIHSGARDVVDADRMERLLPAIEREIAQAGHRADHKAAVDMLKESENRFRALASNLPGMLFQLRQDINGEFRFYYVSEGCQKLFGHKQHELMASSRRFFESFDNEERRRLEEALRHSATHLTLLNWEGLTRGRVRPKWINLRSTPHRLETGGVEWQGIATNVTHSKDIEAELRGSRAQLAELSSHLEAVKEEERERIARDIHDELGSILVRLKIEVALLTAKLPNETPTLREKARSIEELLDQSMSTASRVARELRPGILKEFGLSAAIECQTEDFAQRSGISCRVQCDEDNIEPDPDTSLALFRIAQEALTNVAKHAHASLVVMRLRRERGNILLDIRDNGRGISETDMSKPKSFGLRGIRERVLSLGGGFEIEPGENGGTHLMLWVPEHAGSEPLREEEPQRTLF
jgi:two-component system sensor histidine kinase UhpB